MYVIQDRQVLPTAYAWHGTLFLLLLSQNCHNSNLYVRLYVCRVSPCLSYGLFEIVKHIRRTRCMQLPPCFFLSFLCYSILGHSRRHGRYASTSVRTGRRLPLYSLDKNVRSSPCHTRSILSNGTRVQHIAILFLTLFCRTHGGGY